MIALYLQFAIILLAVSVQPFALPLFLERTLGGAEAVFLFIALWAAVATLSLPLGIKVSARRSYILPAMWCGLVFLAAHYALIGSMTVSGWTLALPAALLFGLHCGLFWLPRHILVSYHVSAHVIGNQATILQLISLAIGVCAPVVVGVASTLFPPGASFFVAALLAVCSGVPLLMPQLKLDAWTEPHVSISQLFNHSIGPKVRRIHFFEGLAEIWFTIAWVFVFARYIGSMTQFGIIIGLSTFIAGIVSLLSGRGFSRSETRGKLFRRLTLLRGILIASYVLVPLLSTIPKALMLGVIALESVFRISDAAHATLRLGYIYGLSRSLSPVAYQVNRELGLNCGRVAAAITLALGIAVWGDLALLVSIGVAAVVQCGWLAVAAFDHHLEAKSGAQKAE